MKTKLLLNLCCLAIFFFYSSKMTSQTTVNLSSSKDNTIYSESNNSNGQGRLYSGKTGSNDGNNNRRALIQFDLSSIPSGSTVTSVTLTVNASKVAPAAGTQNYAIHEVTTAWGEGNSSATGNGTTAVAPDATWSDAMLGTSTWSTSGGDFSSTSASSLNLSGTGNYIFPSTNDFVNMVQKWIDTPSSNNGLILIGDESTNRSAREFGSKDVGTAPSLNVTFNTLSNQEFAKTHFKIYPNPSKSQITVSFENSINEGLIRISDITGKEIIEKSVANYEPIDISVLTSGMYIINVSSRNQSSTKRFVKL